MLQKCSSEWENGEGQALEADRELKLYESQWYE
jgi:hypothetical protein